MRTPETMRTGN